VRDNAIPQHADPFDLSLHDIAYLQPPRRVEAGGDPGRRED